MPGETAVLQLYDRAAGAVRAIYDSRIATPAILDAAHYFPNANRFDDRWADIRREALGVAGMLEQVPRFPRPHAGAGRYLGQ